MTTFAPAEQAPLPPGFFARPAPIVAQALLGHVLLHETAQGVCAGIIVETEAYDQSDPASHSHRGRTPRNAPMFGVGGTCYVYRSYGIHWCVNIACEAQNHGAAVLLRALEPIAGLEAMAERRRLVLPDKQLPLQLCSGPGKLTQAMGITGEHNHRLVWEGSLRVVHGPATPHATLSAPRVGISQAKEVLWRFCIAGSRYVSAPKPRAPQS